jgi:translation initiation factor 6
MNNKGIVVSRLAEEEEVQTIQTATGLNVAKVPSRFTSVGNLIAANDRGAIISDVFGEESMKVIESTLQVPTEKVRISNYIQVGAMISATNSGALIHPTATESDVSKISSSLGVEPEPATINGGVPFVSSGFLGNTKAILVGNHTRGGELVIIGRAFSG